MSNICVHLDNHDLSDHTLRGILERQAARLATRPLFALPDARLTYAETDELANRTANGLAARGVRAGDRVAALCGNSSAMIAVWFGCAKLGAVYLPVNPLLTHDPLRRVLAHARVRVLVCDAELYLSVAPLRERLPDLHDVFIARGTRTPGTSSFEALVEAAPAGSPPPLGDEPGAPTKLMYTSGTTGVPKGVVWNRDCEATWARCYGDELLDIAEGEAIYTCLPLSHVTCQGTALATLWRGGRLTIDAAFDPFRFWRRVRAAEAVMFSFVGTILSVLARRPPRPDDTDNPVRRIMGSAAPIDLWTEVERRFAVQIMEVWGQTETASCWTKPVTLPQSPGSVGRPTERFEARIVGPDGDDLKIGQPGELWIRPTRPDVMFDGYLRHTEEGATIVESPCQDGWYRTGDLMQWRTDGDLAFCQRSGEVIRRRGEMIATDDIETAALALPGVVEAAAVGVPADNTVEEEIKLCVAGADDLDPALLHERLQASLPRFMVPRYIDVRASLPKTPTTRVRKVVLAEDGATGVWDARRPNRS